MEYMIYDPINRVIFDPGGGGRGGGGHGQQEQQEGPQPRVTQFFS